MRHDNLRGIPRTRFQPALLEEAAIPLWKKTDPEQGSEGAASQKIMPPKVRASRKLDAQEYSCLVFFVRVLIWATRNSRAK